MFVQFDVKRAVQLISKITKFKNLNYLPIPIQYILFLLLS